MAHSGWRHEQAFMEHGSGVEGAEIPPGPAEDGEVAFDGPRFVRELAGVLGMQPGDLDEGDSEEGSSFFSPRASSDSGSSASSEPGAALCCAAGPGSGSLDVHRSMWCSGAAAAPVLLPAICIRPGGQCILLLFPCALP